MNKIHSLALSSGTIEDPEYCERDSNCNIIYVFTSYVKLFTIIICTTLVSIHIFPLFIWEFEIRDSSVGIATGCGLGGRGIGVPVPVRSRIFSSPCRPDRPWGPPNFLSNGTWGSFPGVKRTGRENDHSPLTNTEVKKIWIYTSTPPYAFMA
jgi:hypothetical protein